MTSQTDSESPAPATVVPTRPGKLTYAVAGVLLLVLGVLLYAT